MSTNTINKYTTATTNPNNNEWLPIFSDFNNGGQLPIVKNVDEGVRKALIKSIVQQMTSPFKSTNTGATDIDLRALSIDMDYQRNPKQGVNKLKNQWDMRLVGIIAVSYRDGEFFVVDGANRVVAALENGIMFLPANIFVDLTKKQEAEIFLKQDDAVKKLKPIDTLNGNLLLNNPTDVAIVGLCNKFDLILAKSDASMGVMSCLKTARDIVNRSGADALEWILQLMFDTRWLTQRNAVTNMHMRAFHEVWRNGKENGKLSLFHDRMVRVMGEISVDAYDAYATVRYPTHDHRARQIQIASAIADGKINVKAVKRKLGIADED